MYKLQVCSTEMNVLTRDIEIMTSNGGGGGVRVNYGIGLYRNVLYIAYRSSVVG